MLYHVTDMDHRFDAQLILCFCKNIAATLHENDTKYEEKKSFATNYQ